MTQCIPKKLFLFISQAIMMRIAGTDLTLEHFPELYMHHLPYLHKRWQAPFRLCIAGRKNLCWKHCHFLKRIQLFSPNSEEKSFIRPYLNCEKTIQHLQLMLLLKK